MSNKLVEQYNEIEAKFEAIRGMVTDRTEAEVVWAKMTELEARQADLKKTLLHLIALSKVRDDAWRTLSY